MNKTQIKLLIIWKQHEDLLLLNKQVALKEEMNGLKDE